MMTSAFQSKCVRSPARPDFGSRLGVTQALFELLAACRCVCTREDLMRLNATFDYLGINLRHLQRPA